MAKRSLSDAQIDLLHHIELSEAGWHERAIDQLVLSACLEADQGLDENEILQRLADIDGPVTAEVVRRSIARLRSSQSLVEAERSKYCCSQRTREDAERGRHTSREIEAGARAVWEECVLRHSAEAAPRLSWEWFGQSVLLELVRVQGARTYEVFAIKAPPPTPVGRLFDDLPETLRRVAQSATSDFFASEQTAVRTYVLRLLHAQLLALSVGLPAGSLDAFQGRGRRQVQLKLLLDTNFVFSLLGLHENPSNEAVATLLRLLEMVKNHVSTTMYVTPLTVDEIRRTLTSYQVRLNHLEVTPKLSEVAAGLEGEFSGFTLRYLEVTREAKKRIPVSEYFGPYLRDLLTVLRGRGVELLNEDLTALTVSQPVVDDIEEQRSLEANRPPGRGKGYEAIRHDVTMWHLVSRRRPVALDAPLDAVFWLATIDYRLVAFDISKRRSVEGSIPVCVHPATLAQMLQVWLPRSPALEKALFESLRAAIPHPFDSSDEEMALRILRALSRYEEIDDLPADTLSAILLNQALRVRMSSEPDLNVQVELVRDEIVKAAAAARRELEAEKQRAAALDKELAHSREELGRLGSAAESERRRIENEQRRIEEALAEEKSKRSQVEERLRKFETVLESERKERAEAESGRRRSKARVLFSIGALVALGMLVFGAVIINRQIPATDWGNKLAAAIAVAAIALWLTITILLGHRIAAVGDWPKFSQFKSLAKILGGTAWVLATGAAGNALWEWLKN